MKEKNGEIKEIKEKVLELQMSEQSAKYNQVLVHELNEKVSQLEANLAKKTEELEEVQGLYEYQQTTNEDLKGEVSKLDEQVKTLEKENLDIR